MVNFSITQNNVNFSLNGHTIMDGLPAVENWGPTVNDSENPTDLNATSAEWYGQPFGRLLERRLDARNMMACRHEHVTYTMKFVRLSDNGFALEVSVKNNGTDPIYDLGIKLPPVDNSNNVDVDGSLVDEWAAGWGSGETKYKSIRTWKRITGSYLIYRPTDAPAFGIGASLEQYYSTCLWRAHHEWTSFPTTGKRYLTCYQHKIINPGETFKTRLVFKISNDISWQSLLKVHKDTLTRLYGVPSQNYPAWDSRPALALYPADPSYVSATDPYGNRNSFGSGETSAVYIKNIAKRAKAAGVSLVHAWSTGYRQGEEFYQYDALDMPQVVKDDVLTMKQILARNSIKFGWTMRPEVATKRLENGQREIYHQNDPRYVQRMLETMPSHGYLDSVGIGAPYYGVEQEMFHKLKLKRGFNEYWFPEFPVDCTAFVTPGFFQISGSGPYDVNSPINFHWFGDIFSPGNQTEKIRWLTDGHWWGLIDFSNWGPGQPEELAKRPLVAQRLRCQPLYHDWKEGI